MSASLPPLPEASARHANSFDGLRLLAALMVLFSHAYPLRGIVEQEPILRVTEGLSFGSIAVAIFFAISGYLVSFSWQRDPDVGRFLLRRALRIVPGLACLSLITFLLVGPWLTTLTVADYFRDPRSWRYLLNVFMYPVQHHLPGVFADNPYPEAVNGSLWTLRLEFSFYLIVAFVGWCGVWRLRGSAFAATALSLLALVGFYQVDTFRDAPLFRQATLVFANAIPFFGGAMLARREMGFARSGWLVAAFAALLALSFGTVAFKYLVPLAVPFFVMFVALRLKADFSRTGDYSYGFYLWAFLVEQCLMRLFPSLGFLAFLAWSAAITLALAVLSWHLVEKRALQWKPKAPPKPV